MDSPLDQLKEKIFSKYQKDTWEIKTLGEIATEIISGKDVRKDQMNSGSFPAIRYKDIHDSVVSINKCFNFVDPKIIRGVKYVEPNYLLIAKVSENVKDSGKACAYLGKERAIIGKGTFAIKHDQNPKFLSYIWSTKFIREQIQNLSRDGIVVNFPKSSLVQIKVPLPSLEIQQEIVEFLDKFTVLGRELENEWEKEREKRMVQCEYYRELLFNRGIKEQNWPLKTIGEIARKIVSGSEITRAQLGTGNQPAIKCGDINSSLRRQFEECISFVDSKLIKKPKYFKKGDVLISKMSNKSSTVGTVATYLGNSECLLGGDVDAIKHNQNPKYMVYVLSTENSRKQIENLSQESTVFHLYTKDIKQIQIPLPSLEEQERVVEILDKLYRISHDFKDGIPLLIQKNREQYEFYRELLLDIQGG